MCVREGSILKNFSVIGQEVQTMVEPEARRGKMLPINQKTATDRLKSGRAFHTQRGEKTASFCTFDEMSECVEIRTIVTAEEFRSQGLGTLVGQKVVLGAQKLTDKPIVVLPNNESSGLMRKMGLRSTPKASGFPCLWQECQECPEFCVWPDCHCHYMQLFGRMYEKKGHIFSVIDLAKGDDRDCIETAELYCKVWGEPPWNENDWQPDEVKEDFTKNLAKVNGVALIAIFDGKVVGFTSGWNIDSTEIEVRTDGMLSTNDFARQSVFYVAELAVDRRYRQAGIGKQLSSDLMAKAKTNGAERFLLRTNIEAHAARALYADLGFSESLAKDAKFADRTYWVL